MNKNITLFNDIQILPRGVYLQIGFILKTLDPTIIRSNEPEEVLTYKYQELGNRFIIPWRKFKGKLRRLVMEQQRNFGISTQCALKDNLCMKCPACFLFGGTGETSKAGVSYNLLSRVLGETLISTTEVKDIFTYTANAVDEKDYTTGQALITTVAVPAEIEFLGIITLKDPTKDLAAILIDNLNRVKRIGASTREWGRCEVNILGYILSDREDVAVYELIEKTIKEKNKESEIRTLFKNIESLRLPLKDIKNCYKNINSQIEKILKEIKNEHT
ncbi:MAG: type I-D CRISPR-associated protein Cas7/Csc2 [Elusimicrobiota bacterium]|nr:type I-D CRISPR-associated protein Cas7/Csc2 [Endomicrobiia bacterium]MDW8166269.1 type I-D CRISPR-associated protein Cas7/Csc2 [Elusimicrobiota bacterium]